MEGLAEAFYAFIIIFILFVWFLIRVQNKLSRKTTKKLGLVLPMIFFILSIFAVIGDIVNLKHNFIPRQSLIMEISNLMCTFIFFNLPTFILLLIYYKRKT